MEIIKNTTSLCPECMKEIDAEVFEEGGKVYMAKNCPSHGKSRVLIEKDPWLYRELWSHRSEKRKTFHALNMTLTHECNNECAFCYIPKRKEKEKSLEEIKSEISKFRSRYIRLSGGEPTLRKELPEIIRFASEKGKTVGLLTNGIKLSDSGYIRMLKDAGFFLVHISVNSLDREFMKKIEADSLPAKLMALKNLKELDIMTYFSFMLIKNGNEKEIGNIIDFCLREGNIIELRIRSAVPIGRYMESERFFMSDIVSMVSKPLGREKKQLLMECIMQDRIKGFLRKARNVFPCKFNFSIFSNKKRIELLSDGIDYDVFRKSRSKNLMLLGNIMKRRKSITLKLVAKRLFKARNPPELNLALRSWPDKNTLDFGVIERCTTSQLTKENKTIPFCYSLVMNEKDDNL